MEDCHVVFLTEVVSYNPIPQLSTPKFKVETINKHWKSFDERDSDITKDSW